MNYKTLKNILLQYLKIDRVKRLLAKGNKGKHKPSGTLMIVLEKNHGVPAVAWENIRAWLSEQEAKERAEREAEQLKKAKKESR